MAEPKKTAPKKTADDGMVSVRVNKQGDGKISTGERKDAADVKYSWKDTFETSPEAAASLEARGFAEIEG